MKVLICDDSALARKSLSRCIAELEHLNIQYAEDGNEALAILVEQNIDVLFLDLTMPIMDGYEVLTALPVSKHPTKVVVVSGDVQLAAQQRCMQLGAYAFIEKPLKPDVARPLFENLNLRYHDPRSHGSTSPSIDPLSKFREITNVALGRGAAILSDHFGQFIQIPIPHVGVLSCGELTMMLEDVLHREGSVAVAQRFVGGGIHGEALVCMRGEHIPKMGEQLSYKVGEYTFNEVVLNIANLLVSSYLISLSEQINVPFSLRQPSVIDYFHQEINSIGLGQYEEIFTVEYTYVAENADFECEVLFLVDPLSVGAIKRVMESF